MSKTLADIEHLKSDWLQDPCWDIEETDGFEEFKQELLAFRLHQEDRWAAMRREELLKKAADLGVNGNLKLALYVERLEDRIAQLEKMYDRMQS